MQVEFRQYVACYPTSYMYMYFICCNVWCCCAYHLYHFSLKRVGIYTEHLFSCIVFGSRTSVFVYQIMCDSTQRNNCNLYLLYACVLLLGVYAVKGSQCMWGGVLAGNWHTFWFPVWTDLWTTGCYCCWADLQLDLDLFVYSTLLHAHHIFVHSCEVEFRH